MDEIEVEALPTELPEKITLDVTKLTRVGEAIKVKDVTVAPAVTVLTEPEAEIVKIGALVTKEAVALEAEEAAAQAAKAAETATETPAAQAGGETAAAAPPGKPEVKTPAPTEKKLTPETKKTEKK